MLGKGKVCCQKVVTSSQVSEAKCNHDRDEMMKGSEREEEKEGGEDGQTRCQLLKMKMSQTGSQDYMLTKASHMRG